jgi:hypothetical protein
MTEGNYSNVGHRGPVYKGLGAMNPCDNLHLSTGTMYKRNLLKTTFLRYITKERQAKRNTDEAQITATSCRYNFFPS